MAEADEELILVHFLVPICDRAGSTYPPEVQVTLEARLTRHFGGWSLTSAEPLAGAWRDPATGAVEHDLCWRYEVGVVDLDSLDRFLADLARELGQAAIWRVAYANARGRAIPASGGHSDDG